MAKKKKPPNRSDGRWQTSCNYSDKETGEKKRKFFISAVSWDDVLSMKADFSKELAKPQPTATDYHDVTLAEWMQNWLYKIKIDEVRTKTWEDYESINRNHITPCLGDMKLSEIQTPHIRDFLTDRKNTPVCRTKKPTPEYLATCKKRSMRSVEYIYVTINAALEQAMLDRIIPFNPCAPIRKPTPETREIIPFSDKETYKFLELASEHFLYGFFLLAWYTGCRSSELLGLRWQNVDLKKGTIDIAESTMQTRLGAVSDKLKNDSSYRRLDIPPAVVQTLTHHQAIQDKQSKEFGILYKKHGYVFAKQDGSLIPNYVVSEEFKKLALLAGMNPRVRFHDFRHTHATMLFQLGEHPYRIQAQMGHATQQMTRRYTHLTNKDREGIAEKLEERMKQIQNTKSPTMAK